jgi:uncharacterized protein YkwD
MTIFKRVSKRRRDHRRLGIELLEDRRVLSVATLSATAQPTNFDQYLLELVNRGRANPTAEASRYGINLNQGLAAGTISTAPKQPLAFSPALIASSRGHSQWMIDTNTFSHIGQGGSSPNQRMTAAGYSFGAPSAWAENLGWRGTTGTFSTIEYVNQIHKGLFLSPLHRVNQMHASFREFGTGVVSGKFLHQGTNYNALMVTEDFAVSGTSVFLTGVVYDDNLVSANGFYTPGEGLGGVTVTAIRNSDGQSFSTQTWASGGYTLPLNSGTYTVTVSGGALGVTLVKNNVSVENQNVKVDFTRADNAAPVVSSLVATPSPIARPGTLTLTAGGVSDANGQVARVQFYRDTNGNGVWDPSDEVLGTDQSASGGWTWFGSTAGWTLGQHRFFARAQDNQNAWSQPVAAVVNVTNAPPTIGSLVASPSSVVQSNAVTMIAAGLHDPDGTIVLVEFYWGSELLGSVPLGSVPQGSDGWSWTADTANWPVGQHTVSARAQDNDGAWSETISTTVTVNAPIPVVASLSATPTTVVRPGSVTLTASGVSAPIGEPVRVEFYRGSTRLGVDENGADDWEWTASTANWPVGEQTFSARVQSSSGAWSEMTSTTAMVQNAEPLVASLSAAPTVVLESGQIELTADGVMDPDGTVVRVEFYRGGVLLGSATDGSHGWTWAGSTSGWPAGTHEFSARAWDNDGASGGSVTATATVVAQLPPVDFGVVPVFAMRQRELVISNDGPQPVLIPEFEQGAPFAIHPKEGSGESEDWVIAPGSSRSFLVTYAPTEEGSYHTVLPLMNDLLGRQVELGGQGVAGWRNTVNPFDVDGSGAVTPEDVLLLINEINRRGARQLAVRTAQQPGAPWFLDPNGDGHLTPADVLEVINHINRGGASAPEGEADRVFSDWDQGLVSLLSNGIADERPGGTGQVASRWPERHEDPPKPTSAVPDNEASAFSSVESSALLVDSPGGSGNRPLRGAHVAVDPFELETLLSDLLD